MNTLESLMNRLERLQSPTVSELQGILRQVRLSPGDIECFVAQPENGRSYGRQVIFRNAELEAIVIHLPALSQTSIHDHGESIGCALVVEGKLTNQLYTTAGYGMVHPAGSYEVTSGSCMLAPYGQIHEMLNRTDERMISLHVYAPPLAGMKQYVPESSAVLDYVI
ncbi:cysteine dioxygenase family protein [Paenibacillus chartarius]|uniref:Cysteine dioxygenase family protein n=1 Tax=Paenibacillus chartarius TaxID=747481 RepID=A0ABV6DQA6_9BACL